MGHAKRLLEAEVDLRWCLRELREVNRQKRRLGEYLARLGWWQALRGARWRYGGRGAGYFKGKWAIKKLEALEVERQKLLGLKRRLDLAVITGTEFLEVLRRELDRQDAAAQAE